MKGHGFFLMAPIVRGRKGEFKKELAELTKRGFQRVKIDGTIYEIADAPTLGKKFNHDIDVVVDRLVVRQDMTQRLADSLETCLTLADGLAVAELADAPLPAGETAAGGGANKSKNETHERLVFSAKFACPVSGFTIEEIEPRLFSFNNPFGACPSCDGLGTEKGVDPQMVVPDENLTLRGGAILPWSKSSNPSPYYAQTLEAVGQAYGFKLSDVWRDLDEDAKSAVLYGTGGKLIEFNYDDGLRTYKTKKTFEGVIPNLERRWRETDSSWSREEIEKYMSSNACESCHGQRLKPEALAVKLDGKNISEVTKLSIHAAHQWFTALSDTLNDKQNEIAKQILKEIPQRPRGAVQLDPREPELEPSPVEHDELRPAVHVALLEVETCRGSPPGRRRERRRRRRSPHPGRSRGADRGGRSPAAGTPRPAPGLRPSRR